VSQEQEVQELKVAGGSDAKALGSSIAHYILEGKQVQLRALGAAAVNQSVKAVAIANGWVAPRRGKVLALVPSFMNVPGRDGFTISGLVMNVIET
jgi:stage V sporulation protein S